MNLIDSRTFLGAVFLGTLLLASCGGSGGGNNAPPPLVSDNSETVLRTAPGDSTGAATTGLITAATGGTLTTPDNRLSINIPAGALSEDTTISIEPITSKAPGATGVGGFRLGPDGTVFNKPVTLTFAYTDAEVADETGIPVPEIQSVFTRGLDGVWTSVGDVQLDTTNRTVSVQTSHFSDFENVRGIYFPSARVVTKGSFSIWSYTAATPAVQKMVTSVGPWQVEGVNYGNPTYGTFGPVVEPNLTGGRVAHGEYYAPKKIPTPNPVVASVRINMKRADGSPISFVLSTKVTIVSGYVGDVKGKLEVGGNTYQAYIYDAVFDPSPEPTTYILWPDTLGPNSFIVAKEKDCSQATAKLSSIPGAVTGMLVIHTDSGDPNYGRYFLTIDVISEKVSLTCNGKPAEKIYPMTAGSRCPTSSDMKITSNPKNFQDTFNGMCDGNKAFSNWWKLKQQ